MKIGLITGEFPPMQGGVGDFTRELAQALNGLGHEAHVITGCGATPLHFVTGALSGGRDDSANVHRVIESWGARCWKQIADVVHQHNLEVLNVQYEPAAYAMRVGINFLPGRLIRAAIKRPIITTFHDLLVPYLFPKAGSLRWKVVEYLAGHSDAVITTNEEDQAKLANLPSRISNLHVIPIGSNIRPVPVDSFVRMQERSRWNVRSDEQLIGYFGFLNLSKGGEGLMRALKALLDAGLPVKLLLIGGRTGSSDPTNAEYAAQVERVIAEENLRDAVITTGYLDSIGVSSALLACDVMALPYADGASLRRGSLMAAIAHGRAIVTTTPRHPIDGLTQAQSVVFVPPNDLEALATAIRQVLNDAELRRRLESGAREAAKLFTWDQIAMKTVEVYRSVTSGE